MKKIIISILLIVLIFFGMTYNKNNIYHFNKVLESGYEENNIDTEYKVGEIILMDGTVIEAEKFTTINTDNLPVAVIAGFKDNGDVFGLGVHRSNECLQWIPDENNYSAFDFVNAYAETYQLTGEYVSNWYMPNIEELKIIYRNREIINISLQKIYELDNSAAINSLDTNWYWSSSQSDSQDDYAWFVHFFNGYAGECPKNFTNLHVLTVHDF